MDKEDELLEEQIDDEDDLLDFDLDDLSPEDIDQEITEDGSEEETIALVDLVKKGEKVQDKGDEGIATLSEDDKPPEGQGDVEIQKGEISAIGDVPDEGGDLDESMSDLDLTDISLEADLSVEETPDPQGDLGVEDISESDLEKMLDDTDLEMDVKLEGSGEPEASLEDLIKEADIEESFIPETPELEEEIGDGDLFEGDLEGILEEKPIGEMDKTIVSPIESDEALEGLMEEADIEEPLMAEAIEPEETDEGDISKSDLKEILEVEPAVEMEEEPLMEEVSEDISLQQDEVLEQEEVPAESVGEELVGISEEKMEAIVTRVVQDVVERVARETMANVAEKVITEAIDALKQSLESDSD